MEPGAARTRRLAQEAEWSRHGFRRGHTVYEVSLARAESVASAAEPRHTNWRQPERGSRQRLLDREWKTSWPARPAGFMTRWAMSQQPHRRPARGILGRDVALGLGQQLVADHELADARPQERREGARGPASGDPGRCPSPRTAPGASPSSTGTAGRNRRRSAEHACRPGRGRPVAARRAARRRAGRLGMSRASRTARTPRTARRPATRRSRGRPAGPPTPWPT